MLSRRRVHSVNLEQYPERHGRDECGAPTRAAAAASWSRWMGCSYPGKLGGLPGRGRRFVSQRSESLTKWVRLWQTPRCSETNLSIRRWTPP